ncbi:17.9 kDa class I heat shock protein [Apostasia shenzhenica]|uniref:17.9 kDa class I heat shock protein n=1 Tax=Apostasia shenzhenica TaxID=1088818 RepID=A0A2H9ZU62_9ASPA|nr:17.9 kDa class I heat shock protein [Apostasia shenzhenica]
MAAAASGGKSAADSSEEIAGFFFHGRRRFARLRVLLYCARRLLLPFSFVAITGTRVDWRETLVPHVCKADLPGIKKEEVEVEVEDGRVLQICDKQKRELKEKTDNWHRIERNSGRFLRRFWLPENAKTEGVRASWRVARAHHHCLQGEGQEANYVN